MEHITGYMENEVMGKGCGLLGFSQCFGKACPNGFMECGILNKGKLGPVECLLRHKEGHAVPVIKNVRVIKQENGTVYGIVEAVTDLSELHNTKRKMKEASGMTYQRIQTNGSMVYFKGAKNKSLKLSWRMAELKDCSPKSRLFELFRNIGDYIVSGDFSQL